MQPVLTVVQQKQNIKYTMITKTIWKGNNLHHK